MSPDKPFTVGPFTFKSRLILGSGKYPSFEIMERALEASGTEAVTVALRRVDLAAKDNLLRHIDRSRYKLLPNTAGCYNAADAIRVAQLARELGMAEWLKLEVLGDEKTLLPDTAATLEATKTLVKEGFVVLAYTNDDPIAAKRLEDAGAAAVMPLGSPIGCGRGILNPTNIRFIVDQAKVPIIVDAGVGTASDVAVAMELGIDGVLLNTGVALAKDPVLMASAMKHACLAGREAFLAGRIPKKLYASASSPAEGMFI